MQPSMSNVMITTASPPAPLLLERGVDSEFPYLLILYFMKYFIHFICSIDSYKFFANIIFSSSSPNKEGSR